jgi:hypothetical protein
VPVDVSINTPKSYYQSNGGRCRLECDVLVIFFETKEALAKFKERQCAMSAQVSAVAAAWAPQRAPSTLVE